MQYKEVLNKQLDMSDLNKPYVKYILDEMTSWILEHESRIPGKGQFTASDFPCKGHCREWEYAWTLANAFNLVGKDTKNKRWLDVGSGNTIIPHYLSKRGFDTHSIDLLEHQMLTREQNKIRYSTNFDNKIGSAVDIPYPDNYFDVVSSFSVIEHVLPDTLDGHVKAMKEASRVLKVGGFLVMTADVVQTLIPPLEWWKSITPNMLPEISSGYGFEMIGENGLQIDWKKAFFPGFRGTNATIVSIFLVKRS